MRLSAAHNLFNCQRQRGVILILTLWIVLVLTLLAHSLAFDMQVEAKLTSIYRDQFKAEQIARIGIARAVTDLRNDRRLERTYGEDMGTEPFDALGDVWADGSIFPRPYEVESRGKKRGDIATGHYELLIIDEESKLNLNRGAKNLEALRYLLILLKVKEDEALLIANAIYDWTDPDDIPIGGEGESERIYYTELAEEFNKSGSSRSGRSSIRARRDRDAAQEEPRSFLPKNARFNTLDELLLIPGITPELFYGYDPEEEAEPDFFPRRTLQEDRKNVPGLRDLLTVRTNSMNVNTASFEALAAVFAAAFGDEDSGKEMAETIIDYRQGNSEENIDNRTAFRSTKDLYEVQGFSSMFLRKVKSVANLTFVSDNFTIYCRASEGKKKPEVRSSRRRREESRAIPTAHIIAECKRTLLKYPIIQYEDEEESYDDPMLPGFRGAASARTPSNAIRGPSFGNAPVVHDAWLVPVVYFKRWHSY